MVPLADPRSGRDRESKASECRADGSTVAYVRRRVCVKKANGRGMNGGSAFLNECYVLLSMCLPCMPPPPPPPHRDPPSISHSIHFLPLYLPQLLQPPSPTASYMSAMHPAPQSVDGDGEVGPLRVCVRARVRARGILTTTSTTCR